MSYKKEWRVKQCQTHGIFYHPIMFNTRVSLVKEIRVVILLHDNIDPAMVGQTRIMINKGCRKIQVIPEYIPAQRTIEWSDDAFHDDQCYDQYENKNADMLASHHEWEYKTEVKIGFILSLIENCALKIEY
jgi:hypothetical protein